MVSRMPDAKARPILWSKFCRRKLENKKRTYARLGLKELWIIDPVPREVLVDRFEENLGEPVERLHEGDIATSPLLPELAMDLREVLRSR